MDKKMMRFIVVGSIGIAILMFVIGLTNEKPAVEAALVAGLVALLVFVVLALGMSAMARAEVEKAYRVLRLPSQGEERTPSEQEIYRRGLLLGLVLSKQFDVKMPGHPLENVFHLHDPQEKVTYSFRVSDIKVQRDEPAETT